MTPTREEPIHPRDDQRLIAVVQHEHARLVGLLTLRVGSRPVAEELAQDALADLVARWPRVDDPPAWLTRVALNKAASWWRRRGAERRALRRHGPDDTVQQPRATADELAVHDALAVCSDRQQRVLLLRWFLGLGVAETAELLEIAPGTVRSATHRALARLRDHGHLHEDRTHA